MLSFSIEMNLNQRRIALEAPLNTRASRVKQVIFHRERRVLSLADVEVLERDLSQAGVQTTASHLSDMKFIFGNINDPEP